MFFSILVPTIGLREVELNRLFESLSNQKFKDFEVVLVSQINHSIPEKVANQWSNLITIQHVRLEKAGLSYARNEGLVYCKGEWTVLSDDDAWYPEEGLADLSAVCLDEYDIVLTKIYDPIKCEEYKSYKDSIERIKNKFQIMSRSSIEIAFNSERVKEKFDEQFGLGAKYVCGEEVDFLLRAYNGENIFYYPKVTVFHEKKEKAPDKKQQFAKGALYAKNFSCFVAMLIGIRDIIKHRDVKEFRKGFNDYRSK